MLLTPTKKLFVLLLFILINEVGHPDPTTVWNGKSLTMVDIGNITPN